MSTLSLRKVKHDSSSVDNIVTNSDGGVGIGGIDPSTLPSFVHHAIKVSNGGGLGIQSDSATDNRWIFFGNGTSSGDVQRAGIVNQGSDQSLALATAGIQRLRIDSSGRMTNPYQPAFTAIKSDNGGQVGSGVYIFNQVTLNVGNHYNNTNGRFTAPISGVYYFITRLQLYGSSSGTSAIYFTVNGSNTGSGDYQTYDQVPNATTHSAPHHAALLSLTAGDYVEVVRSEPTRGMQSNFCGYLVG